MLTTVSLFASQEGAEESVKTAAKWVGDNLAEFEPSRPTVTAGQVLFTTQ